jgi:hypothetical protein
MHACMPPAGSQQQILRTIDFWQLSRAAGQQVSGPSAHLLDFLAHHPYCMGHCREPGPRGSVLRTTCINSLQLYRYSCTVQLYS